MKGTALRMVEAGESVNWMAQLYQCTFWAADVPEFTFTIFSTAAARAESYWPKLGVSSVIDLRSSIGLLNTHGSGDDTPNIG